jgi:GNAT superfamily N-acetyltransferase
MSLTIVEESPHRLARYAEVPIGFTVAKVFGDKAVAALARGEPAAPTALATPYWKDYDEYRYNDPTKWPARFDTSRWTILGAYRGTERVGGAVIIVDDPKIDLLRDCSACALLWDLRVGPNVRGQGIGSALLRAAESAASQRGARAVRVETQQVNVPACRLYRRHGFRLERVTRGAYADLPSEVQLLWIKLLT